MQTILFILAIVLIILLIIIIVVSNLTGLFVIEKRLLVFYIFIFGFWYYLKSEQKKEIKYSDTSLFSDGINFRLLDIKLY